MQHCVKREAVSRKLSTRLKGAVAGGAGCNHSHEGPEPAVPSGVCPAPMYVISIIGGDIQFELT